MDHTASAATCNPMHEVIMRQKYNDPRKLKAALDYKYGTGNYHVKVCHVNI